MNELRVPKRRITAEALLPDGARRRIALFLSEAAPGHAGPERPSDLLNGAGDFIPAFDEDGQEMSFLQRGALAAVRVARDAEADGRDGLTLATEHEVDVVLVSGTVLRGVASYLRPPEHARLFDFLNEPQPFFQLVDGDAIALVNKRHVARVVLVRP